MVSQEKKPRGRPAAGAGAKTESVNTRMTPEQKTTFKTLGGNAWLSQLLDRLAASKDATKT